MKKIIKTLLLVAFVATSVNAYQIKPKDYAKETSQKGIVVVEFWAPWCGSCKVFQPDYESAKSQISGIKFVELNVDGVDDVETTYGLKYGLPTLIMFKNGAEVSRLPGGGTAQEVIEWIKKYK